MSYELISLGLESCSDRALESRCLSCDDIVSTRTLGVRQYVMWDAASVALLKKLRASGHSAGQTANRLGHSQRRVRQVAAHGLEARLHSTATL
jgi:hypothetical protein